MAGTVPLLPRKTINLAFWIIGGTALLALFAFCSCSSTHNAETSTSADHGAKYSTAGTTAAQAQPEGQDPRVGGKGMPAWFPAYPRWTPKANLITPAAEGVRYIFTFTTNDPARSVIEFYRNQLTSSGFKVAQSFKVGTGALITLSKDKCTLQLSVDDSGKETVASFNIEERK